MNGPDCRCGACVRADVVALLRALAPLPTGLRFGCWRERPARTPFLVRWGWS